MTIERAVEIVLEEAERFEQNAQMLARDAQDPDGKCAKWADVYREKARALRLVAEHANQESTMRPLTAEEAVDAGIVEVYLGEDESRYPGMRGKPYVRHPVGCSVDEVIVAMRRRKEHATDDAAE